MQEIMSFDTKYFPPAIPDECQPNPGVIGFEVCWYFIQELAKRGVITDYPQADDWAWYFTYGIDTVPYFNVYIRSPFEDDAKWTFILEPIVQGMFKKYGPPKGAEIRVLSAMKEIVEENSCFQNVVWHM